MTPDALPIDRVQGLESDIGELVLHDGRTLAQEIGGGITSAPTLTRSVESSSSLEVQVYDPDLSFLRSSLLAEKFDAKIDGLWFRYLGTSKSGRNLTLRFEDRDVAIMRETEGPKKAFRAKVTRAEFVKTLVEEGNPRLKFICPQLHVKQPVKTERQSKKAKDEAKESRGPGIDDVTGLTVKGAKATAPQVAMGDRVLRVAFHENAPFSAMVALVVACIVESELENLAGGDRDSAGVLQVRVGIHEVDARDVEAVVQQFLNEGFWGKGGAIEHANQGVAPGDSAQLCQGSGPDAYDSYVDEAREWVEAFLGGEGVAGGSATQTIAYTFEVGKKETYWAAIQRLAKEVNWRAFVVAGRFYFMPEAELYAGMVRLAIEAPSDEKPAGTKGVEDVDFDFNANKRVTEATVSARVKQWKPPPGSVVTLAGYGPASIGFGDAPVKANKKGQKQGISSNRNARTGEGRGRYIVSSIQVPIADNPESRLATITLREPTAKLPEPNAETKSTPAPSGAGVAGEMGVLEGSPEDIVNSVVDYAHDNGFPDVTRESVRAANSTHGPTSSGGRSDHQGPPDVAWAADISNGVTTPEETALAAAVAKAFGIPWNGAGLITHETGGYRLQLIFKAAEHYDHVHFGCARA